MRITCRRKTCKFCDVKQGECFIYNNEVYMKVYYKITQSYTAVNMNTGEYETVGLYADVNPVNSRMEWEYEG